MLRRLLHEADPQFLPKLKTMDDAMIYSAARKCLKGKQIDKELPTQVHGQLQLGRLISGEFELKDSWKPVSVTHLVKRKSNGPFNSYKLTRLPKPFLAPRRLNMSPDEPILTLKPKLDRKKQTSGEIPEKGQNGQNEFLESFEKFASPENTENSQTPSQITPAQPPSHKIDLKRKRKDSLENTQISAQPLKMEMPELTEIGCVDIDEHNIGQVIVDLTTDQPSQPTQSEQPQKVKKPQKVLKTDKKVETHTFSKTFNFEVKIGEPKISANLRTPKVAKKGVAAKPKKVTNKKSSVKKPKDGKKSKSTKKSEIQTLENKDPEIVYRYNYVVGAIQDDGSIIDLNDLVALKIQCDRLIRDTAQRVIDEMSPCADRRTLELFHELFQTK